MSDYDFVTYSSVVQPKTKKSFSNTLQLNVDKKIDQKSTLKTPKKVPQLNVKAVVLEEPKEWYSDNESNLKNLYKALSIPPDDLEDNHVNIEYLYKYKNWKSEKGFFQWIDEKFKKSPTFRIAYTVFGTDGFIRHVRARSFIEVSIKPLYKMRPVVLFLHGVPTNRRQWYPVAKMISYFADVICIDMLGMGESSMPKNYRKTENGDLSEWDWVNDTRYIHDIMINQLGFEKFVFVADDWGGGILSHYCAEYPEEVSLQIQLDPIAFDGYPVNEIQDIGKMSGFIGSDMHIIKKDEKGKRKVTNKNILEVLTGNFPQTLVQIYKTMVHDPSVYNQFNLRDITFPYVDSDYERQETEKKLGATSTTMETHQNALEVLMQRSSRLAPAQLLPYHKDLNTRGVNYLKMKMPTLIIWGLQDNMMPAIQRFRFQQAMRNAEVHTRGIDRAGHFAAVDKPKEVAEAILSFMIAKLGVDEFPSFWGFKGIQKKDEKKAIEALKTMKTQKNSQQSFPVFN